MKKSVFFLLLLLLLCAGVASAKDLAPERLIFDKIGADSPIEKTDVIDGELQVMDGGKIVSFWGDGPLPGNYGNALFAAHNMWNKEYTPYSKLPELEKGDSLVIRFNDGSERVFTIDSVDMHITNHVPSSVWHGIGRAQFCTMVSCAGTYSKELGTHDRRCVITFSMEEHKLLNDFERMVQLSANATESEESAPIPPPRPLAMVPATFGQ